MWPNNRSINKAGRITHHQSRKTNKNKIFCINICKKPEFPYSQEKREGTAAEPGVPRPLWCSLVFPGPSWGFSDGLWEYLLGMTQHKICYFIDWSTSRSVFWKWKEVDSNIPGKEWGSSSGQGPAESWWSQKNRKNNNTRTKRPFSFMKVIAISFPLSLISPEMTPEPVPSPSGFTQVMFSGGNFQEVLWRTKLWTVLASLMIIKWLFYLSLFSPKTVIFFQNNGEGKVMKLSCTWQQNKRGWVW